MGCPRQKYWSGLLFPSPGDLPDPGTKPVSPILAGGFFTAEPPGKPHSSLEGGEKNRETTCEPAGNAKEYSNYCTIALISHTSKVMLKILQTRLQQYVNHELPDVQVGFRKGRGTRKTRGFKYPWLCLWESAAHVCPGGAKIEDHWITVVRWRWW